jgi:hypothetical protein
MNNLNPHNLVRNEQSQARADLTPTGKTDDASQHTGIVACLLLVPSDAEEYARCSDCRTARAPFPFPGKTSWSQPDRQGIAGLCSIALLAICFLSVSVTIAIL